MSSNGGFATPVPAGLIALALPCVLFFALMTGKVTGAAAVIIGLWCIGAAIIQYTVGVIELKSGAVVPGNVFLLFGVFFYLITALDLIVKYYAAIYKWPMDPTVGGWAALVLTITLIAYTPAYFKGPYYLTAAIVSLDVGLALYSLMSLQVLSHAVSAATGYCFLIAAIFALILSGAIIVNTAYGRAVIPIPAPKTNAPAH